MTIAILTRPDFRSPRVLADSLKIQLEEQGIQVEIFNEINLLNRMVSFKESKLSAHFWLKRKWNNYFRDKKLLEKLKTFDAIIISECTPNGFLKRLYNVEKFRKLIQRPVGFYEVYYLGNAPGQMEFLEKNTDASLERYDFHLAVSDVTEIKVPVSENYFSIGIRANSWNLKPLPKKEFIAIVDFVHPGNESIRESQISALNKAGINYISLEKPYTFEEIRKIYLEGSLYFLQSSESFGIPILECLCCGCQIFTKSSGWPMSWRLDENPEVHGEGILPDCFTVYHYEDQLVKGLQRFKENYDLVESPKKIFDNFLLHYPQFFHGNGAEFKRFETKLKSGAFNE